MTTIAYRDGVVAADGRSTRGGLILPGSCTKLFRLDDGSIVAMVGDVALGYAYRDWLNTPGDREKPDLGDSKIVRFRLGQVSVHERDGYYVEEAPFCAWGSGSASALAALHMGASAQEAVQIAMLVDPYSGGEIITMNCEG